MRIASLVASLLRLSTVHRRYDPRASQTRFFGPRRAQQTYTLLLEQQVSESSRAHAARHVCSRAHPPSENRRVGWQALRAVAHMRFVSDV